MTALAAPVTVALLAVPGYSSAATLYGLHDALAGARREWGLLHGLSAVDSPFRPVIVTCDGRPTAVANGVPIVPGAALAALPRPDVVCVANLQVSPAGAVEVCLDEEVEWLRSVHAQGGLLAGVGCGAGVLASTGLLDGLDATSHWAYCDALRARHPSTRWHPDRALVVAGDGGRLLTAGSGIAWHRLVLALIARFVSPEEAMRVVRVNLFDPQEVSPLTYASLSRGAEVADAVVARCQRWIAEHYDHESPVTRMVAQAGLPERSFKRRFTQATGMSPIDYVHALRLEAAKQRLVGSDAPVEAVAVTVGYQDASFFGRLFHRKVGLTPGQYRRRFGALHRTLEHMGHPPRTSGSLPG